MKITAHMIVKNEENFVWYAVNSVVNFVDGMMIWDQGSTDRTVEIVKTINNPKITLKKAFENVQILRQKMLEETNADWIFILDGDEIWHGDAVAELRSMVYDLKNKKDCIAVPNYMLIGDIFHYQEQKAGRYKIAGKIGHYNVRAIKVTPGLHLEGIYPNEAYVNGSGVKVQNLPEEKIVFLETPYLHASFLKRSSKDIKKIKYEIGDSFPKDFYYPEVFFKPRPAIVPSPWQAMTVGYKLNALWQTPLKKIKRRLI